MQTKRAQEHFHRISTFQIVSKPGINTLLFVNLLCMGEKFRKQMLLQFVTKVTLAAPKPLQVINIIKFRAIKFCLLSSQYVQ